MKLVVSFFFILLLLFLILFLFTLYRLHKELHLHPSAAKVNRPKDWNYQTQYVTNVDQQKIAYWYFPVNKPKAVIKCITVPTLFISAQRDEELNGQDAVNLYNQANQPKELWKANTSHDVFRENPKEFTQKVLSFLDKYASFS